LRKKAAENDPDAADPAALESAQQLPNEPSELDVDLGPATERELQEAGLQISGLRGLKKGSADTYGYSDIYTSDDGTSSSSGEEDEDEDHAERDEMMARKEGSYDGAEIGSIARQKNKKEQGRRPSTTEAKERTPLDSDDEEGCMESAFDRKMVLGEGPFADPEDIEDEDSDEDEMIEIKSRRAS
jgi:hypothetical protein